MRLDKLETERAQRLLNAVPEALRADVTKTLRLIQINAWLAGHASGHIAGWNARARDAGEPEPTS